MSARIEVPCPFCGATPVAEWCAGEVDEVAGYIVHCAADACPAQPFVIARTPALAREQWCQRAPR
jgi:hypothetical protein